MKYIVYETTNLVNNKIYIGVHKTVNPEVFDGYLGCGCLATQPWTYMHPKTAFQYAIKKHGPKNFKRKVLAIFDTLEEASNLERELVNEKFLQRPDVYNMILGGINDNFYNEVACYQYDLKGNFIKSYKSIREASIELNCDHSLIDHAIALKIKGKESFWTNVKYDKLDISEFNLGLNHQIPIYVYLETGEFFAEFPNQTQAAKEMNVSTSQIKNARIFGILVKGFYFCTVKDTEYTKARKNYVENRPVYKYDGITNVFLKEYKHQCDAEVENPNSNISKAIKLKKPCANNFYWSLEKLETFGKTTKNKKRLVGQYDLNGNLIHTYESATAAAKENGTSVWKVLNGTNKTQKGFVYKYLN